MSETVSPRPVSQPDMDFAVDLLNKGETAGSVHAKLVERGLTAEAASALLNYLFGQAVSNEAITLLNQGFSPDQVKRQLAERGLEATVAASVVDDILARHRSAVEAEESNGAKPLLRFLGTVVFLVGVGLYLGNVTGAFPTFPMAGYIVTGVGFMIVGAAETQ